MYPFGWSITSLAGPYGAISIKKKPEHNYIGLIATSILKAPEQKLILSDIYKDIRHNYPQLCYQDLALLNSIRENLTLNDCFIVFLLSANVNDPCWTIHPANIDDFKKGDFSRRKAQRKIRQHMGLPANDDDGRNTPSPPPFGFVFVEDGADSLGNRLDNMHI